MPVRTKTPFVYLDKVERKLLEEIKTMAPQYEDLDIDHIAHDQLKKRLFEVKRLFKDKNDLSVTGTRDHVEPLVLAA
jgi:hypothetical protein